MLSRLVLSILLHMLFLRLLHRHDHSPSQKYRFDSSHARPLLIFLGPLLIIRCIICTLYRISLLGHRSSPTTAPYCVYIWYMALCACSLCPNVELGSPQYSIIDCQWPLPRTRFSLLLASKKCRPSRCSRASCSLSTMSRSVQVFSSKGRGVARGCSGIQNLMIPNVRGGPRCWSKWRAVSQAPSANAVNAFLFRPSPTSISSDALLVVHHGLDRPSTHHGLQPNGTYKRHHTLLHAAWNGLVLPILLYYPSYRVSRYLRPGHLSRCSSHRILGFFALFPCP